MHNRFFAAVLSLVALVPSAGARKPKDSANDTDEVNVIRLINTAESAYFKTQGRYANLTELVQSGQIQRSSLSGEYARALRLMPMESVPQRIADFTLNLSVSPNGDGYHLYLTQKGQWCGAGWFTDETGILYGGKAVSCAENVATAGLKSWSPPNIDAESPAVRNEAPCPLSRILQEASLRAAELVDNLQRFTALETIEHTEFGKNGKPRKATNDSFNYVAEVEQGKAGAFWIEEYRSAKVATDRPPLSDTGTAAFALIFHPHNLGNFDIRCEGETDFHGTPAWQLRFEESSDPSKSFHQIRIGASAYQLRFKGRAWIAGDNYEVLRLQTDLVAPIPQIALQLEHLDISYAPVDFERHKYRLWLPETASMHISYRGHRYQRVHNFSHFQLFLVDTNQKVKDPLPPQSENSPPPVGPA